MRLQPYLFLIATIRMCQKAVSNSLNQKKTDYAQNYKQVVQHLMRIVLIFRMLVAVAVPHVREGMKEDVT